MSTSDGFNPGLLVPIVIAIVFAYFRKHFPVSDTSKLPRDFSLEELNLRFRYVQWGVGLALLVTGATVAWVVHRFLVTLNQSFAVQEGPASFVLLPSAAIWWFLPGFGALAVCWDLVLFMWSLLGDRRTIDQYVLWTHLRSGFNSTKILRWMALIIALPIGVATLLATPMHSTLHDNEIHIREYASLTSLRYRYSDARRLAVVSGIRDRDLKFSARAEVLLKFADGRRWSSADNRDFEKTVDENVVNFLATKTGLPVEHAEVEGDLPLRF
jgi:hypothetical protein